MKKFFCLCSVALMVLIGFLSFTSLSGAQTCSTGQRTYNFTNNCGYEVWVAAGATGSVVPVPSWKWALPVGQTKSVCLPEGWTSGRFWARTGCAFDSGSLNYHSCASASDCAAYANTPNCYNGVCVHKGCSSDPECASIIGSDNAICFTAPDTNQYCILKPACATGDCNGGLQCTGTGGDNPSTLAEFTLGVAGTSTDNYDISGGDGIGTPVEIAPIPNTFTGACNKLGCMTSAPDCPYPALWNTDTTCPAGLQILSGSTVVGCLGPQDYCSRGAAGATCGSNSDCRSGVCTSNNCVGNGSIDCDTTYSIGQISCSTNTDCPPLSALTCDTHTCPSGFSCETINGQRLCVMNCVSGKCVSVSCTQPSDCQSSDPSNSLYGQNLGCDLTSGSPTINTCQPTSWSMYGCVGINHTSCLNTGSYGTNATWCCGCSTWQESLGQCQAKNTTWRTVAEPYATIFHNACPTAYSFPYDDSIDMSCLGDVGGAFGYNVTFCPADTPTTYRLTVTPGGKGSGTVSSSPAGISCGTTCTASFTSGATVTLTATAASGYAFDSWVGCTATSGATCTVTMGSEKTVTAVFNKPPTIAVSPASLSFGTVKKGAVSANKTVTVKNNGVGQLVVNGASILSSTEFAATNGCSQPLDKGESCKITVNVMASAYGTRTGQLRIASNDPKKGTVTVNLTANAKPPVMTLTPGAASFGSVTTGQTSVKHIKVKNTGLSDLAVGPVTQPANTDFTVDASNCTGTLAQNATCVLDVSFKPSAKGAASSQFTIGTNYSGTPKTVKVSGTGK